MSPLESEIAQALKLIKPADVREGNFIAQLDNWKTRPMTESGKSYLMRLLSRYGHLIDTDGQLRSRYLDEQLGEI